jgi:hypothetical protein
MRALYERKRAQLTVLEAKSHEMPSGPGLTLQIGLGVTDWLIEWCKSTEHRLTAETDDPKNEV